MPNPVVRYFLSLCLLLSLVGCAGTGTVVLPPKALVTLPSADYFLQEQWTNRQALSSLFGKKSWDLFDETLVLAGKKGAVIFIDTLDGSTQKTVQTPLHPISALAYNNGVLIIANKEGRVMSIDHRAEDVAAPTLWQTTLSGEVLSRPLILDDQIIIRTLDGKVYALGLHNGRILWTHEKAVPALSLHGTSTPILSEDKVVVGLDDGQLIALGKASGRPLWKSTVAVAKGVNAVERLVDIDATPVADAGAIYASAYQTRTVALASESGRVLWASDVNSYRDLALDQRALYLIDNNSRLYALDKITGESRWVLDALERRGLTAPIIDNKNIIVGDFEGYIHVLDSEEGRIVARIQVSGAPVLFVTQGQGKIIALTENGALSAFSLLSH